MSSQPHLTNVQVHIPSTTRTIPFNEILMKRIFKLTRKTIEICMEIGEDDNLKDELDKLLDLWNEKMMPNVFDLIYTTASRVQASISEDGLMTFTLLALMYTWADCLIGAIPKLETIFDKNDEPLGKIRRIEIFWDDARKKFKYYRCDMPIYKFIEKHPPPRILLLSLINPETKELFERLKKLGKKIRDINLYLK